MPRKVKLEDGSEIEIPTDEENAAAKKAQDELAAINNDPAHKNWRELRQKAEDAEARAKAAETERDQLKNAPPKVEAPAPGLTIDQIKAEAAAAGRGVVIEEHKNAILKQYSPEDQKTIGIYFDKLAAGETLTIEKVNELAKAAHSIVFPATPAPAVAAGGGQPPRFKDPTATGQEPKFSESEEGKSIANEIFGEESFAKPPAK